MITYWILLLITAFFAYTIGSISTQRLASQLVFRRNLRRLGTGNLWLSNFRRIYGIPGFLKLLAVEVVKDLLPILLGALLLSLKGHADAGRAFAGFCLLMGRMYPVFNRFRGGHGSVALVVAALCVDLSVGIAAAVIIAAVSWFSRYLTLGAAAGALVVIITAILVVEESLIMELTVMIALLVIFKHIPSIVRVFNQKEERLSFEEDITYKLDDKF
ncbi:MAG: glycerol-3-phosphate acyltransferase [Oscillospiraceae bacterium]|nr:glycerol-3-phosphate acyltransferase [Oscillospiraceae bacterium]MBQ9250935.1 glycerol-3-phosphate acyltransferase [Oscillospiraceae bacterium]